MAQWFFHNGQQQAGPLEDAAARDFARANPGAHCWREGFTDWLPVGQVAELYGGTASPPPPPPPPGGAAGIWGAFSSAIDSATSAFNQAASGGNPFSTGPGPANPLAYTIHGHEMQYVEVALAPGDSAIAEAGALLYKDASVDMATIFGDGSARDGGGVLDQLWGAGKRVLSGSTLFTTVFTQRGVGQGTVAFSAPYPGTISALKLSDYGGRLICHKDSFLAAARGVAIGIYFQRRILTGLFGGDGFIMQKLEGDGIVFIHMGGTLVERTLAPGEVIHVDTGCLAAMTADIDFDVEQVGGIKSMLFGGEGLFFARLRGPGKVWLQSLPFSRLAGRMLASSLVGTREEGGVFGAIGNILDKR
ncbi:MAG: TIGR00266 family protein [Azospirillaceae bacterium]|nr:TIGR00266 family protein [Azospirillaceae bacterium]